MPRKILKSDRLLGLMVSVKIVWVVRWMWTRH